MEKTKGIESLRAAVLKDCNEGQGCFNENGCDHEYYRTVPQDNPRLLEMGFKTSCILVSKCFHQYCDKYKWVLDRAKHYSEFTGKTVEEIVEAWEVDRSYCYMNYYQDCNQPLLKNDSIIPYDDWVNELNKRFGNHEKWAFKCPKCGHVQTFQDFIDIGQKPELVTANCIGRYKPDAGGCDWSLGGLLQIHKQSVLKDGKVYPVFEMAKLEEVK